MMELFQEVRVWYPALVGRGKEYCYQEKHSVLGDRGWILQERMLSSQVLYFGSHQKYFECKLCRHF